jgi:hypothetical protein
MDRGRGVDRGAGVLNSAWIESFSCWHYPPVPFYSLTSGGPPGRGTRAPTPRDGHTLPPHRRGSPGGTLERGLQARR